MRTSVERVTAVPGAASATLRSLLDGPPRPARVLGVGPAALFVIMPEARGVFALCTHDAVRLPLAIVVAASSAAAPWAGRASAGDPVTVGGGSVCLPGLTIHVARWWAPARPHLVDDGRLVLTTPVLRELLGEAAIDLPGAISANLRRLRLALVTGHHEGARRAVDAMLGLGPGLTPAGDDAVAGLLLAVRHLGEPREGAVMRLRAHVLATAPRRTNAVSAALLGQAAQGYAAPEVIAVLSALATGCGLPSALRSLLLVGHTSGGDLAQGIASGALLVVDRLSTREAA